MEQCEYYFDIESSLTDNPKRRGPVSEMNLKSERAKEPFYAPGELFASFRDYRRKALAAQFARRWLPAGLCRYHQAATEHQDIRLRQVKGA